MAALYAQGLAQIAPNSVCVSYRRGVCSAENFHGGSTVLTSMSCAVQGAFMAALYAQGLAWERMHEVVREYAGAMGSVRHLLSDLTLPIISVFSGAGFDRVIRQSFLHGAQRIEDLWLRWGQAARLFRQVACPQRLAHTWCLYTLAPRQATRCRIISLHDSRHSALRARSALVWPSWEAVPAQLWLLCQHMGLKEAGVCCSFFCMTTNMTRGEPTVHQDGLLWKLVRASMTIVGLIPPVYENGELLIDGGYLNNMPVDVMRGLGVDTVSSLALSSSVCTHR